MTQPAGQRQQAPRREPHQRQHQAERHAEGERGAGDLERVEQAERQQVGVGEDRGEVPDVHSARRAGAPARLPSISFMTGGEALGSRPKSTRRLLVPFLRLAALVELAELPYRPRRRTLSSSLRTATLEACDCAGVGTTILPLPSRWRAASSGGWNRHTASTRPGLEGGDRLGVAGEALDVGLGDVLGQELVHDCWPAARRCARRAC